MELIVIYLMEIDSGLAWFNGMEIDSDLEWFNEIDSDLEWFNGNW